MTAVILLATVETKAEETTYFRACLRAEGLEVYLVDTSLHSAGHVWDGPRKIEAMASAAHDAEARVAILVAEGATAVVGLGGGTGGEIILRVMQAMPFDFPKVLVTTLPFDPRYAVADNSIILIPTLADICGMNTSLRRVLGNASAVVAGLARAGGAAVETVPSVGITALGATHGGADGVTRALRAMGQEATVFHANGFGGAAFTRFVEAGTFKAVVDLTMHEMTRIAITGVHLEMPYRFLAAGRAGLPQIALPGGLNFLGFGEVGLVPPPYLDRPHYRHTTLFTHVKLLPDEMAIVATRIAAGLAASTAHVHLIVPMGGFSHQDRDGGAIEDEGLRHVFLDTVRPLLPASVGVEVVPSHINDPDTAARVIAALQPHL